MKSKVNNSRGYTLLEILIALVILSVGILATSKLQISFMQGNSKAINITEGSAQVQAKIEELFNTRYANLANGNDTIQSNGGNGPIYNVTWTVAANTPIQNTSTVTVTVTWPDEKNIQRSANYSFTKTLLFIGAEW